MSSKYRHQPEALSMISNVLYNIQSVKNLLSDLLVVVQKMGQQCERRSALVVALQEPVSKTTARLAPADVNQLRKQRAVVAVPAVPGP